MNRIEANTFARSSLRSIVIPSRVEIIGLKCFALYRSLCAILFEPNGRLRVIGSGAFSRSSLQSVIIPKTVEILDSSSFDNCLAL
jgi:hypothetical protein